MRLPSWLRRADAPVAELVEQQTATVLDLASTQAAERAAAETFRQSGTPDARRALQDARQAAADAALDAERAAELTAAAEAVAAKEARQRLEAQFRALSAELADPDAEAARLSDLEVAHLYGAVTVREQRAAHASARGQREHELEVLRGQLGHHPTVRSVSAYTLPTTTIADRLRDLARGHGSDTIRSQYLHQIAIMLDPRDPRFYR